MAQKYHLAQLNVARAKAPVDDPIMQGFASRLAQINALADAAPGFIWRLKDDQGDATSIRAFDDALILVNMSVWESIEALKHYVYRTAHAELLRDRRSWFEQFSGAMLAMWWVPAGHIPSVEEAKERLAHLEQHGPSAYAFTFRTLHEPAAGVQHAVSGG